jgi:hypothetical protein
MPGTEIVLRPEPRPPASVPGVPWQQEARKSEAAPLRLARWARRNTHFTVPLAVPPVLWLAALILHQVHPAAYVVPLCGALLAGCIWVFAPHRWDRPAEQLYARLSAALGALWLWAAAFLGPASGTVPAAVLGAFLLAGCIAWGVPWWRHKRPRGMKKRQKLIAQCDAWWQSHCHNWNLLGSHVIDARLSGVSLTMRVQGQAGLHSIDRFRQVVHLIESAAEGHADVGLVRVDAVKGHPSQADVVLKKENPLQGVVEYDMALAPRSAHDPAPFGRLESGGWWMTRLRRNRFTNGESRSGKSNDLLLGMANLSGCADARTVLIDLKGGRSSRPVLESGAAEYVITDADEARMYLRMLAAEIASRAKGAYDGNEQLLATEEIPAIFTLIDEVHGLTSAMNGDAECARLLAIVASQGMGLECYVWVFTQFGSLEESVRTEQTRGNLLMRTCYRVAEARHGAYCIPEYSKLDASKLEEDGTCYVKDGKNATPEQIRAAYMPHELLARIAGQNARLLGGRPPLRLYCGGRTAFRTGEGDVTWQQWWDRRWLRLDPELRGSSPQYREALGRYGESPVTEVAAEGRRADIPVPSPEPGSGDAASAAARLAADDAELMSRVPDDFAPDPRLVAKLPAAMATQEDRFADALEAADATSPVTPRDLIGASGFGHSWVHDRLNALVETGFVTQVTRGRYAALPGSDIRLGLKGIRERNDQLGREARQKISAA